MNKLITIITICATLGCSAQTKFNLNADAFEKGIAAENAQVLDVRTQEEFNSGHIANTLWANWNDEKEFNRRIGFINKSKPVYVYCLSGGRSASAAKKMRSLGFKTVYELSGGISAWRNANKPLESASNQAQMAIETFNNSIQAQLVLVDFGANWCAPCKVMDPIVEKVKQKMGNKLSFVKVDAGKDVEVCKQNNVTTLPVFAVYKAGKVVWQKVGVTTEEELLKALQ
jgi:thioredoxin